MVTKRCGDCKEFKSSTEFTPSATKSFGLHHYCYACDRKHHKIRYATQEYKNYIRAYSKKKYVKHRLKHLARSKVGQAITAGKLYKPKNCSLCSRENKIEAHHRDYTKPLEVEWLCHICHRYIHGRLKDMTLLAIPAQTIEERRVES